MIKNNIIGWAKGHSKTGFSYDLKSSKTLGKMKQISRWTLISGWGKLFSNREKLVSRSAQSQSWLCPFNTLADFGHKKWKFITSEDRNKLGTKTRLRLVRVKNAPAREQMRLFASNIKELRQDRIGAPSCGWTGEGGTLQRLCSP